jgi:hypothetical protein
MKRTIKISLEIPLVQRGNFDVITKGLDNVANDFSILDLTELLHTGKIEKNVNDIKVEYKVIY